MWAERDANIPPNAQFRPVLDREHQGLPAGASWIRTLRRLRKPSVSHLKASGSSKKSGSAEFFDMCWRSRTRGRILTPAEPWKRRPKGECRHDGHGIANGEKGQLRGGLGALAAIRQTRRCRRHQVQPDRSSPRFTRVCWLRHSPEHSARWPAFAGSSARLTGPKRETNGDVIGRRAAFSLRVPASHLVRFRDCGAVQSSSVSPPGGVLFRFWKNLKSRRFVSCGGCLPSDS